MEDAFSVSVTLGSPVLALITMLYLPEAIWDSETGRYRGYFNRKAVGILLFVLVFFGFLAAWEGRTGPEIVGSVGLRLFLVIISARLIVEYSHHYKYKIWLHRQYHKLTDHDDPRGESP